MGSRRIRGTARTAGSTLVLRDGATDQVTIAAGANAGAITITLPDAAGALVTASSTTTFTNKSIDGGTNTLTNIPASALTGLVALNKGGTNKNMTAVNGGLVWSDADSLEVTAAGTAGQWVLSGGASSPTMSNTTTTGKTITGSADEIQFKVTGFSGQSAALLRVEDGSNVARMLITETGVARFGDKVDNASGSSYGLGLFGSSGKASILMRGDTEGALRFQNFQGSFGSETPVVNATTLGRLQFEGLSTGTTTYTQSSGIIGYVDGTVSAGVVPGAMSFRTYDSSGVVHDRLILRSSGNAEFYGNELQLIGSGNAAGILKMFEDSDNGTNYIAVTAPQSLASNFTWTYQAATDTFVGLATNDVLTNKKLSDSTTSVVDVSDNTKRILFDAGGTTGTSTTITAAQTANRVVTLFDATDTVVGKATTDTLTNKTLGTTSMTGFLTLSADPTAALHAVTKQYVDAAAQGLYWKQPVKLATTTSGTLATSFENGDAIDGITLVTGDRILIKNQGNSENGVYTVNASGAPTRATDMDAFAEFNGAVVFVTQGTANGDKGFMQIVEMTSLSDTSQWVQNFGTGLYVADGQGIELSGSTFSLELDGSTLSKSASGVKVATGGITNTEVNASAAIAYSKLNLSASIVNADVATAAAIARTKVASGTADHVIINDGTGVLSSEAQLNRTRGGTGISSTATFPASGTVTTDAGTSTFTNKTFDADGTGNSITNIENADIKTGAAIARNKLASGTADHVVINDGTGVMSSEAALSAVRGGTGVSNNAAATLTRSGNHAVTLTTVATTSLTLPISGALAPVDQSGVSNYNITAAVAANALTVALKTSAGTDAAAGDVIRIGFRSSTATSGVYNVRTVTGALSVVVSSGSTLGHANGVAYPIFIYALDNAGTVELAVSTQLVDEGTLQSTTAEGGAGAADSNSVMYSTTARSNVPVRLIGKLTSSQATAGTWASAMSTVQLLPIMDTPGRVLQGARDGSALPTGTVGEYLEAAVSTATTSSAADTDQDVTDLTLTLTPGIWLIGYHVCSDLARAGTTGSVGSRHRITTSANVAVANTEAYLQTPSLAAGVEMRGSVSRQTVVNISANTTYKVRQASTVASASGTVTTESTAVTSALTNPDNSSVMWALRIA